MSKVFKRLCVFFIGVPLILFLVSFSYLNHIFIQLLIALFSIFAGNEFYNMLSVKSKPLFSKSLVLICIGFLQIICYLSILSNINLEIVFWVYIFELLLLLGFECLNAKSFELSFEKFSNSAFIILYCGFFITFISRITTLPEPSYMLALYLIIVFMCDSGAWFFGVLFGKSTRGIVAASPNKSLVGFIGGIASSIASAVLVKYIFPEIFNLSYLNLVIISLITAISAIIGDLVESVIKRSLDCKDSGTMIPGRGGVLDSIDSLLVAAPVFYIAIQFLFK